MVRAPSAAASPLAAKREQATRPSTNLAGAVYGQILSLAVLGALAADSGLSAATMLASVFATMLVFWAAHAYAGVTARRVRQGDAHLGAQVLHTLAHEWPIVQSAAPVMVGLALGAVGLLSRDTALWVAFVLGVAALFGWGLAIGRRSGRSRLGTLALAALNTAFGLLIVGLKLLVH